MYIHFSLYTHICIYACIYKGQLERTSGRKENIDRAAIRLEGDEIDSKFGFDRMKEGPERLGYNLIYVCVFKYMCVCVCVFVCVCVCLCI
jgi:hypothetical protein